MSSPHSDNHANENNQNNANSNILNTSNVETANSDNNNNTNGATNLSTSGALNYNNKLLVNDVLRTPPNQHLHQQYQQIVSAAAANIAAQNQNSCNGIGASVNPATSAAQAVASLAAVMRQNQPLVNGQSPITNYQNNPQMHQQAHQQVHQDMRIHQAEALLRSQAEAALRLAVSQAAAVVASSSSNDPNVNNQFHRHHNNMSYHQQQPAGSQIPSQFSPDLSEALRLQEQRLEQALRLHNSELGLHQQHHQQP